jgi:hypothetical protein
MNRKELQEAITTTLEEIEQVKREIEEAIDPREERRLMRPKKELQIRQLWNLDQLEGLKS